MADVALLVNGRAYAGWKSARVTRGMESIAGSFALGVSERWNGQDDPWPIVEEDACQLTLDGEVVLTGYVDRRAPRYAKDDHTLEVSGRDRTGALVDCSAVLASWEFDFAVDPVPAIVAAVAKPFGIPVTVQPGLTVPPPHGKLSVDTGETAFDVIDRVCRKAGVLPVSDGAGGLLLTRAGTARATTALVEGQNILTAEAEFTGSGRFRRYVVDGQRPGFDTDSGETAAHVQAQARDDNVRRAERVLVVRAEGNVTQAYAQQRANWEASIRAAQAATAQVTVQGWQQGDGRLWPVNALVVLHSPFLGIHGPMLITEATYSLSDQQGTVTTLKLKRPDAFRPEPTVPEDPVTWNLNQ